MKSLIIQTAIILGCVSCFGQGKPPLDLASLKKWPNLREVALTTNGSYVKYTIDNIPADGSTLILKDISNRWQMQFLGAKQSSFGLDNETAFILDAHDSLQIIRLGKGTTEIIPRVASFELFDSSSKGGGTLLYSDSSNPNNLQIRSLKNGQKRSFLHVTEYKLNMARNLLVLKQDSLTQQIISLLDLENGITCIVWKGVKTDGLVMDRSGQKIAFLTNETANANLKDIWCFDQRSNTTVKMLSGDSLFAEQGKAISNIERFSDNGSSLFFHYQQPVRKRSNLVSLDIWSYNDVVPKSWQLKVNADSYSLLAVVMLKNGQINYLQNPGEDIQRLAFDNDSLLVVNTGSLGGSAADHYWAQAYQRFFFLQPVGIGQRTRIETNCNGGISPDGKYLAGDDNDHNFCAYDINKKKIYNISSAISVPVAGYDALVDYASKWIRFLSWIKGEPHSFLVSDNGFDIWKIDADGKTKPICITQHFGRRNHIKFQIIPEGAITAGKQINLYAFNEKNKYAGFYVLPSGWKLLPEQLFTGPVSFFDGLGNANSDLFKARSDSGYILTKAKANEFPNYYFTKDFRSFKQISFVYPEAAFNWMHSSLVSFKTLEQSDCEGILYTPENFDARKKYPTIIEYYERKSDNLNVYNPPTGSTDLISIPWFISHGYVVLMADIHHKKLGKIGRDAYNSVMGAYQYLKQFSWVDAKHIGLLGHSFGGFETNYIITHSSCFAAAISNCGMSDVILDYLGTWRPGNPKQPWWENGGGRMGNSLWADPSKYLNNSPILFANKIVSPLLFVANQSDATVNYEHGKELSLALRRLGKPSWMLQYDGQDHVFLFSVAAFADFNLRAKGFFDYYLKEMPPPKWMIEGIPTRLKSTEDGLDLMPAGTKPGPNLLTPAEQKKVDALQKRKSITVILK
jgi:dipeptidyl aminopeptidase/acylaminoacyl peptidase